MAQGMNMGRRKKAQIQKDERGQPILTQKFLKDLCFEHELFQTPALNDKMYLHYKGIHKIESLQKYTGVKALWLECNGIRKIQGLQNNTALLTLFLQQNCIQKIEGLDTLQNLVTLNLSHNRIKVAENLGNLPSLKNLDLSSNCFMQYKKLFGLLECKSLTSLDISKNYVEYEDGILDFLLQLEWIICLYFKGNPAIQGIRQYRKRLVAGLKNLRYLDDRPVKQIDRDAAEAWVRGGFEEEKKVRRAHIQEQRKKQRGYIERAEHLEQEAKRKKKLALQRIEREAMKRKQDLILKHKELKQTEQRQRMIYRIRKVEHDLNENDKLLQEEKRNFTIPLQIAPGRCTIRQRSDNQQPPQQNVSRGAAPQLRSPSPLNEQAPPPLQRPSQQRKRSNRMAFKARLSDDDDQDSKSRERNRLNQRDNIQHSPPAVPSSDSQDDMNIKFNKAVKRKPDNLQANIKKMDASAGSDSENDTVSNGLIYGRGAAGGIGSGEIIKWKQSYQEKLQELLVNNQFDFQAVAKEFRAYLKKQEPQKRFQISERILQKYRMKEIRQFSGKNQENAQEVLEEAQDNQENEEDDNLQQFDNSKVVEYTNLEQLD